MLSILDIYVCFHMKLIVAYPISIILPSTKKKHHYQIESTQLWLKLNSLDVVNRFFFLFFFGSKPHGQNLIFRFGWPGSGLGNNNNNVLLMAVFRMLGDESWIVNISGSGWYPFRMSTLLLGFRPQIKHYVCYLQRFDQGLFCSFSVFKKSKSGFRRFLFVNRTLNKPCLNGCKNTTSLTKKKISVCNNLLEFDKNLIKLKNFKYIFSLHRCLKFIVGVTIYRLFFFILQIMEPMKHDYVRYTESNAFYDDSSK